MVTKLQKPSQEYASPLMDTAHQSTSTSQSVIILAIGSTLFPSPQASFRKRVPLGNRITAATLTASSGLTDSCRRTTPVSFTAIPCSEVSSLSHCLHRRWHLTRRACWESLGCSCSYSISYAITHDRSSTSCTLWGRHAYLWRVIPPPPSLPPSLRVSVSSSKCSWVSGQLYPLKL